MVTGLICLYALYIFCLVIKRYSWFAISPFPTLHQNSWRIINFRFLRELNSQKVRIFVDCWYKLMLLTRVRWSELNGWFFVLLLYDWMVRLVHFEVREGKTV